jgi:asparagine synthase (glutamine-hydrolysing)
MFMPWELPSVLDPDLVRTGWRELATLARLEQTEAPIDSPFFKVSALELSWYMRNQLLRDTDWASMDHSLEIRTPFVDTTLFESVAPLFKGPDRPDKRRMADTPQHKLPNAILNRRKTGFSVPVRDWLMKGSPQPGDRGLRGWAKAVYRHFTDSKPSDVGERCSLKAPPPAAAVSLS